MKIAILSDIHEDAQQLERALGIVRHQSCDEIICLGDIIGYDDRYYQYSQSRNAQRCIELIQQKADLVLCGNHDLHVIQKVPALLSDASKQWDYQDQEFATPLSTSHCDFIDQLPMHQTKQYGDLRILFSHFLHPDLSGALIESLKSKKYIFSHLKFMEQEACSLSFVGHAHIEGYYVITTDSVHHCHFEAFELDDSARLIIGPAISRGSGRSKNGFLTFDTESRVIEGIRLFP